MQIENCASVRKAGRSVGTTNYHYEVSPEDREKFNAAADALTRMRAMFDDWITIGYATVAARKHADRVGERKAFQHILAEQRIMPPLDKAAVSHLERVMARLPDVLKWRETLTEHQRIAWATPRSIINHCPIFKIEKERRRAVAPRKATRLENALEENAALKIEVESYRRVGDFEFSSQDRAADIAGLLCRGFNEHKQRAVMKELVRKLGTAKQREAFGLEDDDQPASLPAANGAAAQ